MSAVIASSLATDGSKLAGGLILNSPKFLATSFVDVGVGVCEVGDWARAGWAKKRAASVSAQIVVSGFFIGELGIGKSSSGWDWAERFGSTSLG